MGDTDEQSDSVRLAEAGSGISGGGGAPAAARAGEVRPSGSASVYSFDVFDTAICRTWHAPDHLHWSVGRKLRRRGLSDLSEKAWREARIAAEREARRASERSEINLIEIYDALARSAGMTPEQTRAAMEIEIEQELRSVRPVAYVRDRFNQLKASGSRACFISDMYLNGDVITQMLQAAGYDATREDMHVSSDYGLSKSKGDLYPEIAARFAVPCAEIEHTGDHQVADFRNAQMSGFRAILNQEGQRTVRENLLFQAGGGNHISSAIAGAARSARLGFDRPCRRGIRTLASGVIGPLFTAYVLWVLKDVIDRGGRRIYFCARDGQIMLRICQRLIDWMGAPVEARYLYASRLAYLLPALPLDREELIPEAIRMQAGDTLAAAMKSMQFDEAAAAEVSEKSGVSLQDILGELDEVSRGRLIRTLEQPEYIDELSRRVSYARKATRAYLESEGVLEEAPAFVVDVGWRGTQQLRLERIVGDRSGIAGYYIALWNSLIGRESDARTWTNEAWPRAELIETFARADHTSITGFELDDEGNAYCVPEVMEEPDLLAWGVRDQQDVVDLFVADLLETLDPADQSTEALLAALTDAGRAAFVDFVQSPSADEAECYGGVEHARDTRHERLLPIAPEVTNAEAILLLVNMKERRLKTNWYHGSLARSRNQPVAKAVSVLFRAVSRLRGGAGWRDVLKQPV